MSTIPNSPVTIIVDPNRGYRHWHIDELYRPGGTGQYVPNVDDSVMDWTQGMMRVRSVDYTTGISILEKYNEPASANPNAGDILVGAGPGYQSESFRAYLNTSVMPHALALDRRLHFYGTTVNSVKVFLGTDISENGTVISAYYDQGGTLLGEDIPVELVAVPNIQAPSPIVGSPSFINTAVKCPMVGYSTMALQDGEVVTAVAYDDQGEAVSQAKLLIKNTAFVRSTDASLKYIVDISVETPFLSASDPKLIEYPINMPVANLNLWGVVTYSNGQTLRMPVDGTKFSMYGLGNYVATIQGQTTPLTLSYQLGPDEYSWITSPSPNNTIDVPYRAKTKRTDGAFSIKMFATPVWVDQLSGYRLEYFLYNLDRDQRYNVTSLVSMSSNSAPFDPIAYGIVQRLNVGVNMNEVDPRFMAHRFTQTFEITLLRPGNDDTGTNWTVGYVPGQDPKVGDGVKAEARFINVGNWELRISSDAESLNDWLDKVYYPTMPLFDERSEAAPPVPNYMVLAIGNQRIELPITSWDQIISIENWPGDGKPVYIEFIRRTAYNDLQLAVSGLITHQVTSFT